MINRTLTSYDPLMDGNLTLGPGDSNNTGNSPGPIRFNPPNDIRQDSNTNRPVLCYRVDPSNNASNLKLIVQINGQDTGSAVTLSGGVSRSYVEIISQPVNIGNNNITFELDSEGSGSLKISDVIMFYKRFV